MDLLFKFLTGIRHNTDKITEVGKVETKSIELRGKTASTEVTKVTPEEIITEYPELPYRPVGHIYAEKPRHADATPSFTKFTFDKKRRCIVKKVEMEGMPLFYKVICKE